MPIVELHFRHPVYRSITATIDGHVFSNGKRLYGTIVTGYVQVSIKDIGKPKYAHRIVYECITGQVLPEYASNDPDGVEINHKDGNRRNNRFFNLEPMTHAENIRHGRNVLQKKQFYASGTMNLRAKLTQNDLNLIAKLFSLGRSNIEIAQRFSIDRSAINRIRLGQNYRAEMAKARSRACM